MPININKIVKNLKEVYDPEIDINVFDLGLIYNIEVDEDKKEVAITHTLTSAFCPFGDALVLGIERAGKVDGVNNVKVITTFDPPFIMDNVPEETKAMMGWL